MKKYLCYLGILGCLFQFIVIISYLAMQSWFVRADLGSILGVRSDYSIQLTHDGELRDGHQMPLNRTISSNISRYSLVKIADLGSSSKHDVLIMEEGKANPPKYIIYDDMLDGYVFVNRSINYTGYWVGGYQNLLETDDFFQRRYGSLIKNLNWIELSKTNSSN